MDRYTGRPFLRLLECYVLDAIGHLDDGQREVLRGMEPKLVALYGVGGSWRDIVSAQMDFPSSFPAQLQALWARNLELARERGQAASPDEFAMALVDQNFAQYAQ